MRALYRLVLWLHPAAFRRRFGDEMLSIFDEQGMQEYATGMVIDGFTSLARQWVMRTNAWRVVAAVAGAFIQVWGLGFRTPGQQHWLQNSEALTPYMQQLIVMTLGSLCVVFIMIVWLTLWTLGFQRRRRQ